MSKKKSLNINAEGLDNAVEKSAELNENLGKVVENQKKIIDNNEKIIIPTNPGISKTKTAETPSNGDANKNSSPDILNPMETAAMFLLKSALFINKSERPEEGSTPQLQEDIQNTVVAFAPAVIGILDTLRKAKDDLADVISQSIEKGEFSSKDGGEVFDILQNSTKELVDTTFLQSIGSKLESVGNLIVSLKEGFESINTDYLNDVIKNQVAQGLFNSGIKADIPELNKKIEESEKKIEEQKKQSEEENKRIRESIHDKIWGGDKALEGIINIKPKETENNKPISTPNPNEHIDGFSTETVPYSHKPMKFSVIDTDNVTEFFSKLFDQNQEIVKEIFGNRIQEEQKNAEEEAKIQKELTEEKNEEYKTDTINYTSELSKQQVAYANYVKAISSNQNAPVLAPQKFVAAGGSAPSYLLPSEYSDLPASKQTDTADSSQPVEEQEKTVEQLNALYQKDADNLMIANASKGNVLQQFTTVFMRQPQELQSIFGSIEKVIGVDLDKITGSLGKVTSILPTFSSAFGKTGKEVAQTSEQMKDAVTGNNAVIKSDFEKLADQISEYAGMVSGLLTGLFEKSNEETEERIEQANERIEMLDSKREEMLTRIEESDDRIKELSEQAKTAQGGRLAVIQEQIAREMESRQALANDEKRLATEKEKAEKEKEKLEKQKKKNEIKSQIVQGVANIALGVTKALSYGPIIGPILAAIVGAMGAIQVAQMTKQLSKMADGGLLNGKRHSQGGMRILGTNIEVEGGEYVINRLSTERNLGLVRYINSQRRQLDADDISGYFQSSGSLRPGPAFKTMFASGGELPAQQSLETYDNDRVARAIESINFQPVVSVVDIANVQHNMTQVTEWTNT